MPEENIQIFLSKKEALVLFEFLSRFKDSDSSELDIHDSSEEVVLWKILGILETNLAEPFARNYLEILEAARASLRINEDNYR
jgi:hypothetical protein